MGHYKGRDNLNRRRKRWKKHEEMWEKSHCCSCGANIRNEPHQFRINPKTGKESHFQCVRCVERQQYLVYSRCGIISSSLMRAATQAKFYYEETADQSRRKNPNLEPHEYKPICESFNRIHARVKDFERDVWFNGGLQQTVVDESHRGLSGAGDWYEVRVWSAAGRTLITLEETATQEFVTLITADDEKPYARREHGHDMGPMGIHGHCCTEDTAMRLLDAAIADFPSIVPSDVHYVF